MDVRSICDLRAFVEAGEFPPDAELRLVAYHLVEQRWAQGCGVAERVSVGVGRGLAATDGFNDGTGDVVAGTLSQQGLRAEELEGREQVEQPVFFLVSGGDDRLGSRGQLPQPG